MSKFCVRRSDGGFRARSSPAPPASVRAKLPAKRAVSSTAAPAARRWRQAAQNVEAHPAESDRSRAGGMGSGCGATSRGVRARGRALRLLVIPPPVQPDACPVPEGCPDPSCGSHHVRVRPAVRKPPRDPGGREAGADRWQGPRGGRAFRVSPLGVSPGQTSTRRKGAAALLCVVGRSDGAAASARAARGGPRSKVALSYAGRATGPRGTGPLREPVRRGGGRVVGPARRSPAIRGPPGRPRP